MQRLRFRIGAFGQAALCLALLSLVTAYHLSLDPVVWLLGLAHTQMVTGADSLALIVDHLSSGDAPAVAQAVGAEVWGRHRAQVLGLWLPMAALFVASFGLLRLALRSWDRDPTTPRRPSTLPPVLLGLPLFMGACVAAAPLLTPLQALLPWFAAFSLVASARLCTGKVMASCMPWLSSARWFWLGYLLLSPQGFFRWQNDPTVGVSPSPTALELAVVGVLVLGVRSVEHNRMSAEVEVDPWKSLASAELWVLLPTLAVAMAVGSLQGGMLSAYLLASLATAWLVDGFEAPRFRRSVVVGMLLAGLSLATALAGGLPRWQLGRVLDSEGPEFSHAQTALHRSYGTGQARLANLDGITLLVTCNLDLAQQSEAVALVTSSLAEHPVSVNVRARRWERVALILSAATVTLFLVVPTFLLTVSAPGRRGWSFRTGCLILASLNFAFAAGAGLGWFWLDPLPNLAGFGLATLLAWITLGHARAWVDAWICESVRSGKNGNIRLIG